MDIVPELLGKIKKAFESSVKNNAKVRKALSRLEAGAADLEDAHIYAEELGKILSDVLMKYVAYDSLPDGYLYWNIADRTIRPMLEENYRLINNTAADIQKLIDRANNIGLNPITGVNPAGRIKGLIDKAVETQDLMRWLGEPVVNCSESFFDDFVVTNAKFSYDAGLKSVIERKAEPGCCEWCSRLAGTYDYSELSPGDDVYRRHEYCRCIVTFKRGRARQDIWSKDKWWNVGKSAEERKEYQKKQEKISIKPYEKTRLIEEQTSLIKKYGTMENLMFQGTSDELTRWSELAKQTGLSDRDILQALSKSADNWESLLDMQTEKQLQKFTDQLLKTATDEELSALRLWTSETYADINRYERWGIHVNEIARNAADNIENVLSRMETPEDIIVRRGTGTKQIFEKMPKGWKENPTLLVGEIFEDKGFTATSPIRDGGFSGLGENQAELFIKVPKGTHGAYLNSLAHNDLECELLLQKDCTYKIIKAEYRENPLPQNKGEYDLKVWAEVIKK